MGWLLASVSLLLAAAAAYAWMNWLVLAPLDVAVSLDAPFHTERRIALRLSDRYFLYLLVDRHDAAFSQLRSLVGGAYGQTIEVDGVRKDAGEPPGVRIPIEWWLRTPEGDAVAGERNEVLGANSWSNKDVGRLLYKGDLPAGRYIFGAKLRDGIAEFHGIRARVVLNVDPKNLHSVMGASYWWATLFIPVALVGSLATGVFGLWRWMR
jgi:hypothetical protein